MGGAEPWRALRQRIWLRLRVRRPGRGDRGQIPRARSTPRGSIAGSPRSTAPRSARSFWSGIPTMSPSCGCCWSSQPGAGRRRASGWSPNASRFARACGYRKITLWTQSILVAAREIYQHAGFVLVAERAAPQFRPKPDRRDLGARAVMPCVHSARVTRSTDSQAASPRSEAHVGALGPGMTALTHADAPFAFGRRRCSSSRGMISTKLQGRVR